MIMISSVTIIIEIFLAIGHCCDSNRGPPCEAPSCISRHTPAQCLFEWGTLTECRELCVNGTGRCRNPLSSSTRGSSLWSFGRTDTLALIALADLSCHLAINYAVIGFRGAGQQTAATRQRRWKRGHSNRITEMWPTELNSKRENTIQKLRLAHATRICILTLTTMKINQEFIRFISIVARCLCTSFYNEIRPIAVHLYKASKINMNLGCRLKTTIMNRLKALINKQLKIRRKITRQINVYTKYNLQVHAFVFNVLH